MTGTTITGELNIEHGVEKSKGVCDAIVRILKLCT